jgi:hypothetical protein
MPRYIVKVYGYYGNLLRNWVADYIKIKGKEVNEILGQCIEAGVIEREDLSEFKLVFVKKVHS